MITDTNLIKTYTRDRDLKTVDIYENTYSDNSKGYKIPSENIQGLTLPEVIDIFKNRRY